MADQLPPGFDLSKLVPSETLIGRVEAQDKLTRITMQGPDGQPAQLLVPVYDMKLHRINNTTMQLAITPDLAVQIAHQLLGFTLRVSQQGATPPAPPTGNGPETPPLSTG